MQLDPESNRMPVTTPRTREALDAHWAKAPDAPGDTTTAVLLRGGGGGVISCLSMGRQVNSGDGHCVFRVAGDRLLPRFRLEGVEAGRRVSVFGLDATIGERLGLSATATVGDGGWVDLPEPVVVRAGEGFVAVPEDRT